MDEANLSLNDTLQQSLSSSSYPMIERTAVFSDYLILVVEALLFIGGVYVEKIMRRKLKIPKSYKSLSRILVILFITIFLMVYNYSYQCEPYGVGFQGCFYFYLDFHQCVTVIIANSILFGHQAYLLYQKQKRKEQMRKINKILKKYDDSEFPPFFKDFWRSVIFAPLLEQILFRAIFYRSTQGRITIFYIALVFAIMHLHNHIWKYLNKKPKKLTSAIFQFLFTFLFALYSCYWLYKFQSIIPTILLHIQCNIFGPPIIQQRKSLTYHFICLIGFFLYVILCS